MEAIIVAGAHLEDPSLERFEQLIEQFRSELAIAQGANAEERATYHERLNRAVLGYAEDRAFMQAVIEDKLRRKQLLNSNMNAVLKRGYCTLVDALLAEVIGLSVLETLLVDRDGLEELQVVGMSIYEIRCGQCRPTAVSFKHEQDVERIQQNLVLYNQDRINTRKKWAEVMLRDGTRVTMTARGFTSTPTITMRFYRVRQFSLEQLSDQQVGTIAPEMISLLRAILRARRNIIVIGATNSGKTHLLKTMIRELPDEERLVTIEGRLELMLKRDFPGKNVIEYEVSDEADAAHSSDQAFRLALRQSPMRIVLAEVRSAFECHNFVSACTRGHEGSMTTLHVNALDDVPDAITDLYMQVGQGLNVNQVKKRMTQYVAQVGIQMKLIAGTRRVVRLAEWFWREGEVELRDLARFDETSLKWDYPCAPSPEIAALLE